MVDWSPSSDHLCYETKVLVGKLQLKFHTYPAVCGVLCSLLPWCPLMKLLMVPPAPFNETFDRGSGPICSFFPPWRPLMKPLIAPPVYVIQKQIQAVGIF